MEDAKRPSVTQVIEQNIKELIWTPNLMHVPVLDVARNTLIRVH
jgi:hypothetical protein